MLRFKNLFNKSKCAVIGMIHVSALPGTPRFQGSVEQIVSNACKEAEIYVKHAIDGIIVENMNDVPYIQSQHFGPEVTATLTKICADVRRVVPRELPCGIQVLACGNKEALAIAKATNFNFIRAEGYVFGHIADEGFTNADAGLLLRYRKSIEADNVLIFTDIKKKHSSHSITSDVSLAETVKAAEFFLSDGVILTGISTGDPVHSEDLKDVSVSTNLPILIGSGVTSANLEEYLNVNAVIVGSHFKRAGLWSNGLDEIAIAKFMEIKSKWT